MATEDPGNADAAAPVVEQRGRLFAAVCCALCLAVIWATLSQDVAAKATSAVLFVIFCVLGVFSFSLRERALTTIAVLVTAIAVWRLNADALTPIMLDLSRGAYLAAFMMLMSSLRDGAFNSRSVLEIGRYLTNQPPSRRYFALHIGGHFIGTLLNFSAVSLLGPLVLRGAKAAQTPDSPPELFEIRLRRQISALSRGFSWFNIWAPTAIAQAVVLTTVPGSKAGIIAPLGLMIAFILLWVGWAEDRVTGHRARMRFARLGFHVARSKAPPFPYRSMLRFLSVAAGLVGLALMLYLVSSIQFVSAIMISAVPITAIWLTVQSVTGTPKTAGYLREKLWKLVRIGVPSGSPEAATLGLAGYIGILGARQVDHARAADLLLSFNMGPMVIYIAVSGFIPLASCIGLPPMMMVTFLGGLLVSIPQLGLDPSMLGLSLLVGWALNLTGSPFSATSLLLSRVVAIPGTLHAWRWNGLFTIMSWVVAAIVIFAASRVIV
ncbi:hypothetical protein [Hoeflea sp. TYP-13]|uniref:hypothetical protein n=1 Tax=Hoeflea sp. TYP-13 TaxID=3230023 RepID=UPI0034C66E19